MRFSVLGPLAVQTADERLVRIPDPKVRALLADLLVHHGHPISAARLIDDLWGDELPANPVNTLHAKVSQLRKALEAAEPGAREMVVSQPPGYLPQVEPDAVDSHRFEALTARARLTDDPRARRGLLADALALWRGPAFADFGDEPFARAAIARLEEERLVAVEEHVDVRLELGEHSQVVGELGELVSRYPFRESLWVRLLVVLQLGGRHAEALERYEALRVRVAEELGRTRDQNCSESMPIYWRARPRRSGQMATRPWTAG